MATNKKIMTWNDSKDLILLKEIAAGGLFQHKYLSRERGAAWQTVANNLNALDGGFNISARAVRDRYSTIQRKHKAKNATEEKESGGGGKEPTEMENLLDDLISLQENTEKENTDRKVAASNERQKAQDIRNQAMEGMKSRKTTFIVDSDDSDDEKPLGNRGTSKKRRTSSDTIQWLQEKSYNDLQTREEELKIRREELQLAQEQQRLLAEQNRDQMALLMKQLEKQQQQQQQQQQQALLMQQQMFAFMQNILQKKD